MSDEVEFIPRPERGHTAEGGIYGLREISRYTGIPPRVMKMLYIHKGFPLIRLEKRKWYMHKDLFYMWYLSIQRWQMIEYRSIQDIIIADALKHLETLKNDLGLKRTPEENELFRRIYLRVFGSDDAIKMVTDDDRLDAAQRARIDAFLDSRDDLEAGSC